MKSNTNYKLILLSCAIVSVAGIEKFSIETGIIIAVVLIYKTHMTKEGRQIHGLSIVESTIVDYDSSQTI